MITLYHCHGARSFRPLWMLEEMGLDYELKMLPFPPRMFAKEYLAINPLGTIPFMIDGDTKMTESSGICHYLGTRHGPTPLVVGVDEPAYGAYLNWMFFSDATLTFPQTLVLRYSTLEPSERRQPQVVEDYAKWFLGRLRAVEAAAGQAEWLCAGRFTAADMVDRLRAAAGQTTSGLPRISAPTSPPIGSGCSSATAIAGRSTAENRAGEEQKVPGAPDGLPPAVAGFVATEFRGISPGDNARGLLYCPSALRKRAPQTMRQRAQIAPGGPMSDDECPDSGHLMLISPERVFYAGLLGRPRRRTSGGFSIYVSMQGQLRVTHRGPRRPGRRDGLCAALSAPQRRMRLAAA